MNEVPAQTDKPELGHREPMLSKTMIVSLIEPRGEYDNTDFFAHLFMQNQIQY